MSYTARYTTFSILDSLIVVSAIFISYFLLHPSLTVYSDTVIVLTAVTLLISHHITAHFFHLYNRLWSLASVKELLIIGYAVTISVLAASAMQYVIKQDIYFRVMAVTWLLHILLIGGSRFLLRVVHDWSTYKPTADVKRVLIVGAGEAGTMLLRSLKRNPSEYQVVAIVDDDLNKQHLKLLDVNVCGTTKDIPQLVQTKGIQEIILAIPSLSKKEIREIYNRLGETKATIKIMPKIEDVMTGKVSVSDMQEIKIEDLLGREEVKLDMVALSNNLTNKKVLITGAGGSIGSEICRQTAHFHPKQIIMLGHGENSIYKIHLELSEKTEYKDIEFIPVIADVQDRERIFEVIKELEPDIIYHAAAHKHVPMMESNPREAVKNNIFGTKNIAEAAHAFGVPNFVMISTDKAVNPPNVMGATKRIAEIIIQNLATYSDTNFAAVRFGNVLGSRGSVIPRFKAQIAAGGPVTVTHPDMTRYFMTIPEASRLVLQAGALARGGEVFVLDMGEPMKIVDLAKNLIRLSGFSEEEIEIEFSGIRPGEKMYEELLNAEEIQEEHIYPKIHVGKASRIEGQLLTALLKDIDESRSSELKTKLIKIANAKWNQNVISVQETSA
ncbi:polysaccharide biosynthesis protein [Solibacillus isronensis]|uniref:polysaccharide biosynthesis protein n=1 Tax=Solibacillus isronensis TaxID=412383 RepID=UPI00203DECE0|nr:nucleoside-diphosphate sugar epimerase/dehydratase [Solibacillus isronensis]MCM3722084.1 polysaccharide biosynthesis protein [Solibacillus isronensis]